MEVGGGRLSSSETSRINDDPGMTAVRKALPTLVLRGLTGGAFGRSYAVEVPLTIGRSPECNICIIDPGLSRVHARLAPSDSGLLVEDLNSTNGTFVNGLRTVRHSAQIGDEISFDKVRFRLAEAVALATQAAAPIAAKRNSPDGKRMYWLAIGFAIAAVATLTLPKLVS